MEVFIEKVRNNICLWDVHSLLYRDVSRKEACWENVAKDCGMESGKEAKLLWKRLRDSHREALRRRRTSQGAIARPWKYEELMGFVRPNWDNDNAPLSLYHPDHTDDPLPTIQEDQVEVHVDRLNPAGTLRTFEERAERAKRRRRDQIIFRKKLLARKRAPALPQPDAITELFSSMCKKTKQLPKHLQLRVQREMFEAVSRAEEEALCDEAPPSRSRPRPLRQHKPEFVFKSSPVSDPDSSALASQDDFCSDN